MLLSSVVLLVWPERDLEALVRKAARGLNGVSLEVTVAESAREAEDALEAKPLAMLVDARPHRAAARSLLEFSLLSPATSTAVIDDEPDLPTTLAAVRCRVSDYFVEGPSEVDVARLLVTAQRHRQALASFATMAEKLDEVAVMVRSLRDVLVGARRPLTAEPTEGVRPHVPLSRRELEVAEAIAQGRSTIEIARELDIAKTTVRNHLYSAYRKLNVRNRIELLRALERGTRATYR